MSVRAFREVFEKGLEEDRFAQNNLGCPLTIFYRYPLCLILSIVDNFTYAPVPWGSLLLTKVCS